MAGPQNSAGEATNQPPRDTFYEAFHGKTSEDWTPAEYDALRERVLERLRRTSRTLDHESVATDIISRVAMRFQEEPYDPLVRGPFQAYLYRCIRTLVIDLSRQRQEVTGADQEHDWLADVPDDSGEQERQRAENAMDSVRNHQIESIARRAVELFRRCAEPEQIAVLLGSYAVDPPKTTRELADELEVPGAAVYRLKYQAEDIWKDAMNRASLEISGVNFESQTQSIIAAVNRRMASICRKQASSCREDV